MAIPAATNGNAIVKFPLPGTDVVLPILLLVTPCGANFEKFYLWAVDREVLAEHQIKRESGTRNKAVGNGHIGAPVIGQPLGLKEKTSR
jgi:hypothetical protein